MRGAFGAQCQDDTGAGQVSDSHDVSGVVTHARLLPFLMVIGSDFFSKILSVISLRLRGDRLTNSSCNRQLFFGEPVIRVDEPIGDFDELLLEFNRDPRCGGLLIQFSDTGFSFTTFHRDVEFCDAGFREGSNERYWLRHRLHPSGIGTDVRDGSLEMTDVRL